MKYLLDTCVICEIIKPKPDKNVVAWLKNQNEDDLFLSVLTLAEIEKRIVKAADATRKIKLQLWVADDLKKRFEGRVIPVDLDVAVKWGEIQGAAELSGKPMPTIDGLIAVSGFVHDCVVVTRNTADMMQSKAALFDPWLESA